MYILSIYYTYTINDRGASIPDIAFIISVNFLMTTHCILMAVFNIKFKTALMGN